MNRVAMLAIVVAAAAYASEGSPVHHRPLTLVLDAEKPLSTETLLAMRGELDRLFRQTPIRLNVRNRRDLRLGEDVAELILVRLRGECKVQHEPVFFDELGSLAYTHVTDGSVLPFSEVLCDRVRKAAKANMFAGDFARADKLMGRALARVLAHEIFHILSGDFGHSQDGVFKKGLTGKQLIDENLDFAGPDLERLRLRQTGP